MSKKLKSMLHDTYMSEFTGSDGLLVVDLVPLPVDDANRLRRLFEAQDLRMRVVRNRIARKAFEASGRKEIGESFHGPSAVIFGEGVEAPIRASKVLAAWGRKNPAVPVRAGFLEGTYLPRERARALADLPDRQTALGRLAGAISGPARGFVTVCHGVAGGFVRALHEIAEKKRAVDGEAT